MYLEDLMEFVNEGSMIRLYDAETHDPIQEYDGTYEIPEDYYYWRVTDIFPDGERLGIEIEKEDDE